MFKPLHTLHILVCCLLSSLASAETFTGQVIGIADGDTLTLLVNEHEQVKIRLAEIDAPEKAQPFGQKSKQSLSDMCFRQTAVVEQVDVDRYGRTVAKVQCGGVNVNQEQIRTGMAWAYRKYLRDQTLLAIEQRARESRRGLWKETEPIPPWEWRKAARRKVQ